VLIIRSSTTYRPSKIVFYYTLVYCTRSICCVWSDN